MKALLAGFLLGAFLASGAPLLLAATIEESGSIDTATSTAIEAVASTSTATATTTEIIVHAQAADVPCGTITGPHGLVSARISTVSVSDCDNPFGSVSVRSTSYVFHVAGVPVPSDGVVVMPPGEEVVNASYVGAPSAGQFIFMAYRQEGDDYTFMYSYPPHPSNPDQQQVLTEGIYTLLLVETEPSEKPVLSSESVLKQKFARLGSIPTAHAADLGSNIRAIYSRTVTLVRAEPEGASSVLFLPGIQASRLYTDGAFGTENQLWTPNWNSDIHKLSMNEVGVSDRYVYTRDILDTVFGLGSVYGKFSNHMDRLVADGVIKDWQPYAYDWRYAVDQIASQGTQYETRVRSAVQSIADLAEDSYSGQVAVIAHSNGGLLAKAVLSELEKQGSEQLVDSLVLLAAPQIGTPKAIGTLLHGYDQAVGGGFVIDAKTARSVITNLPGAYGLLPRPEYFSRTNSSPIHFEDAAATALFTESYGYNIDSYHTMAQFLEAEIDQRSEADSIYDAGIVNSGLLQDAFTLHAEVLQPWRAPDSVSVVEVAGYGIPTVSGFAYREFRNRTCSDDFVLQTCDTQDIYKPMPIFSVAGDETVMQISATGYEGAKDTYYFNLLKQEDIEVIRHVNFTEADSVHQLVTRLLTGEGTDHISFISSTPDLPSLSYVLVASHSPAALQITDSAGAVTKVQSTETDLYIRQEAIAGSQVQYVGSTTYILLPNDDEYEIDVIGTGFGGVTLTVDDVRENNVSKSYEVWIPEVQPGSHVTARLHKQTLSTVTIDFDGDGDIDGQITPEQGIEIELPVAPGDTASDIEAPTQSSSGGYTPRTRSEQAGAVAGVRTSVESGSEVEYHQELYQVLIKLEKILSQYEKTLQ